MAEAHLQMTSSATGAAKEESTPKRRLRRVLYAIAMNPDRFAALEEQILLVTKGYKERGGFFLPLYICNNGYDNVPVYAANGLEAQCLNLHEFRLAHLVKLVRLIRHNGIEVVHWHFMHQLMNPYVWALSVLTPRVKHIFSDHISRVPPFPPPPRGWKARLKQLLLKRYEKVIGVSDYITGCLRDTGVFSNLRTERNFLNTERFKPDPAARARYRAEFGAGDRFIAVTVAYLVKVKGIDVAIRALPELPEDVVLWIVGGGEEMNSLKALAQQLGVSHRAIFFGHQQQVQRFLQASDCFVFPSRWQDAGPLVNLEAQATELPVVCSRVGGIPEYVDDGHTGLLFTSENHGELASCIRKIHGDREKARAMGRAGREWVIAHFSCQNRIDEYINIYRA